MALELGRREVPVFGRSAEAALERYPWPGNIRELKNVVERAVYRATSDRIATIRFDPFDLPGLQTAPPAPAQSPSREASEVSAVDSLADLPLKEAVARFQEDRLREALRATRFNQRRAASRLGLTYDQFRGLMRKFKDRL
jgi:psp operon transcriptional activator